MNTISFGKYLEFFEFLFYHNSAIRASSSEKPAIQCGDSGGPLIWNNTLIRITSFLPKSGADPPIQQGFTNVLALSRMDFKCYKNQSRNLSTEKELKNVI